MSPVWAALNKKAGDVYEWLLQMKADTVRRAASELKSRFGDTFFSTVIAKVFFVFCFGLPAKLYWKQKKLTVEELVCVFFYWKF